MAQMMEAMRGHQNGQIRNRSGKESESTMRRHANQTSGEVTPTLPHPQHQTVWQRHTAFPPRRLRPGTPKAQLTYITPADLPAVICKPRRIEEHKRHEPRVAVHSAQRQPVFSLHAVPCKIYAQDRLWDLWRHLLHRKVHCPSTVWVAVEAQVVLAGVALGMQLVCICKTGQW